MKADEVMLGDWVYNEVPCYVTAIYPNGTMDCQGDDWAISTDRVEPIPLTEEILEKNGFVKLWNNNWQFNDYHSIIVSEDFYIAIFELSTRLDYVHELQHALRLCGIEKKIEL